MRDTSLVLAAREATYATAPALTPAANALEVFGYNPEPVIYDERTRSIERGMPGARPALMTRGRQRHQFSFELRGSGTNNLPASWGNVWLGAAMFGAPAVAADEVAYPLISDGDGASVAMFGFRDKMRMTPTGMRGNLVFNFEEGNFPYATADLLGLLPALPTEAAPGTPTFPDEPAPLEVNSENTAFTLGGYALKLRSFTLDLGMKTEYRSLVGQKTVTFGSDQSGDRRQIGGRIVGELPDLSAKNYFTDIAVQTDLEMMLVHGPAANQVELSSATLNLRTPSIGVEQGRLMLQADYALVPSAANNELTLVTR